MTNIDYKTYPHYEDLDNAIHEKLEQVGLHVLATKIRIGEVLGKETIAAIVFLQSAYHARVALKPLSHFGRVHLGQTVATPRIIASKVKPTIQMLLTEADGCASDERLTEDQCRSIASQVDPINLSLQLWLDKDGRISFIKIKIIDLSCTVFKRGHSRVACLLEYIGDENECRQFIPSLVDEFAESNTHTFHLLSGLPVFVLLVYITSDHKALFALTGRSGGNEFRDLFCHFSLASKYHLVLHQGQSSFNYDDFIQIWKKINDRMKTFKASLIQQNKLCTMEMEKTELNRLYREHGRIDRVPAFMNGVSRARPEVTDHLVVTPLNLHNDTYATITTITLLFQITDTSKELRRLQAIWKGLMDGFGQTKCVTSGEGMRRILNECLCLAGSIKTPHSQKFSPLWWLKDTISRHLRLTKIKDGQPSALTEHERLKFAVATLLWWLLLGDLSTLLGGRTLKGVNKNHLQDKIYPFELATACVDFEEISHVPLSLLNESFFEATFTYRDEMINTFHSKVALLRERKGKFFSETLDQLAPNKVYRSHIGRLERHQNRQIFICGCWTQNSKWSLNIKRRLLYRSARLNYHHRITICPTGRYKHAIKIDTHPPHQGANFYQNRPPPPPIFVDQCGSCDTSGIHNAIFTRSLMTWNCMKTITHRISMGRLGRSYLQRLQTVNYHRALHIKNFIASEIKKPKCQVISVQRAYDGYCFLKRKWPQLQTLRVTQRLRKILATPARGTGKVWDGDIATLPDVERLSIVQLKEVIRFYKIHNVEKGIHLKGRKAELRYRVRTLIQRYGTLLQH